jgi:small conductance mechanosensitive channel
MHGRAPLRADRFNRFNVRTHQTQARARLRRFRQGSMLAVAITALLLMLWGLEETAAQEVLPEAPPAQQTPADEPGPITNGTRAIEEATGTIRDLVVGFFSVMPKVLIGILLLVIAGLISNLFRRIVQRTLHQWEKSEAIAALGRITFYILAIGAALSIIAGDARALLGSVGLIGLALSWALQTPIESFTGWLLNSFRGYYRVGDRIEVGDVFGDVYRIDVLTTTVWEAGGPGKAVAGAQSTGAMITFPNWEVLRSNVVNYSREFPYVWDEVTMQVANESDLTYTADVFRRVARELFGEAMGRRAEEYQRLLERARLAFDIQEEPSVFLSLADSWTNCTIRYLVHARERRRWSSDLILALSAESQKPEHKGRIINAYPRSEIHLRQDWEPKESER